MLSIRPVARSLVPVLVATLLAGCAIGPNYKRPATQVTDQYKNPVSTTAPAPPGQSEPGAGQIAVGPGPPGSRSSPETQGLRRGVP